jgi:CheY-like chemotaxis protein
VLIVDDDEINILIESNYLKSFGKFDYFVARNGQEALNLLIKLNETGGKIDIILMDCNMPIKDGLQASKEINELFANGLLAYKPEIIGVTANTSKYDRDHCKQAGMDYFMTKPLKIKELESMLDNISRKL